MKTISKILILVTVVLFGACQSHDLNTQKSFLTGWKTFDAQTTQFEAYDNSKTGVAPVGMLPIQGGTFTIGQMDEFVTAPRNNQRRSITVSSFYMDKYEVTNIAWREYVEWMAFVFGKSNMELVDATLPDTTVWRDEMSYNDPYVENYFRHPAYSFYPVVGVSWDQAMAYCQWRTDRVNEQILVTNGVIEQPVYELLSKNTYFTEKEIEEFLNNNAEHPEYVGYEKLPVELKLADALRYGYETEAMASAKSPKAKQAAIPVDAYDRVLDSVVVMYQLPYEWLRDHFVFNTEKYLYDSQYKPSNGKSARKNQYNAVRKITAVDGMLIAGYRLPTEAEWEYAAFAPIATEEEGFPFEGKIYPWSGYHPRDLGKSKRGQMAANFIRGKGDLMGVAGVENDGFVYTSPVDAFSANDFGLYNMAGNVNEWVLDVYRETTFEEAAEYNPYRGNIYTRLVRDESGRPVKTSVGGLAVEYGSEDDKRNFRDGDASSIFDTDYPLDTVGLTAEQMEKVKIDPSDVLVPRVTNRSRVYKGGSWNDRIYWLNPTTRRYMDQDKSSSTVGFRCAMSMLGQN
jgi:formylglycine-generating enzyme required for sulfatase activity